MTNGNGDASIYELIYCLHHPRNFGGNRDKSNGRVKVWHAPTVAFDKIFCTIHSFEGLESIHGGQKVGRFMSPSFCSIDERAFSVPTQECSWLVGWDRLEQAQKLWVDRPFLCLEGNGLTAAVQWRKWLVRTTTVGRSLIFCVGDAFDMEDQDYIRSHSGFDNSLSDHSKAASVAVIIVFIYWKVEAVSTVNLNVHKARTGNSD